MEKTEFKTEEFDNVTIYANCHSDEVALTFNHWAYLLTPQEAIKLIEGLKASMYEIEEHDRVRNGKPRQERGEFFKQFDQKK